MGHALTTSDIIMCPHGGTVSLASTQARASAGGAHILRPGDIFVVAGCPFNVGGGPHPCVTVEWLNESPRAKAVGQGILTTSSFGMCKAADQAPQGAALIQKTQTKVSAR